MIKFGERIRAVRKNAGCNQKAFCSLLDIPQSTLSAYETDRMQPTISTLVKIAEQFNVSLDWLCGIEGNVSPFGTINEGEALSVDEPNAELSDDLSTALSDAEDFLHELEARRRWEHENIARKKLVSKRANSKSGGDI